jgi:antitoxin component of MazEF toxin-antitoxin module
MHYPMGETVVQARILRWGNSYGIRIRKSDLERAGLRPGEEAIVRIETKTDQIDLSTLPRFRSGHTDTSARHDEILGEARSKEQTAPKNRQGT